MNDTWTVLSLKQGDLKLDLLPGVGGRLWDVVFQGTSLLFQNPDLIGRPVDPTALEDLPTRSPQFGFPLWGGEKTWVSPDSDWVNSAPYPALDSAPYKVLRQSDNKIEMQSEDCPLSRLRIRRVISLSDDATFSIDHIVTNIGEDDRVAGIWSVMMLRHPTTIMVNELEGSVSRVFGDPTPFVRQEGSRLSIGCRTRGEFKIGLHVPSGKTDLLAGPPDARVRLECRVPAGEAPNKYAHGNNVEVFNSGEYAYCEAEWHSPARRLQPGTEMTFTQEFHVSADHPAATGTFTARAKG